MDIRGDEVLIRYIAWDHSFDEWLHRSSARLAQRGTRLLAHMAAEDVLGTSCENSRRSTFTVWRTEDLHDLERAQRD